MNPSPIAIDRCLRTVLDHAPDGVLIETQGVIVYLNETYSRFLGYHSPCDLAGAKISDIAAEADADRLQWFTRCRETGHPAPSRYMFLAKHRNGSRIPLDASVSAARAGLDLLITTFVRVSAGDDERPSADVPGLKRLSPRELEIFTALLRAQRAKQIALALEISDKTVASHRQRIYRKLALRNDLDLFRFAAQHGLLEG